MSIEEIIQKHKKLSKIISNYKYFSKIYNYSNLKIVLSDDAKKQDRINNFASNLIFA